MSNFDSKDDMTALVVRSAHDLATRSSLVSRGLREIVNYDSRLMQFKSKLNGSIPTGARRKIDEACWIQVEEGEWINVGDWETFKDVFEYEDYIEMKKEKQRTTSERR